MCYTWYVVSVCAGTGISRARRATEAGREAAAAAVAGLGGEPPALVVVFAAPRYELQALLDAIRSVTGPALLVGATGSGEMVAGEYVERGAGVGVLAITAGPYRFAAASAAHIREDLDGAGQRIAREAKARAGASPYAGVLVLADSLLGDLQQLVQGIYRITGPRVPFVGGAAEDEQRYIKAFVLHDSEVVEEGAVAVWIASPHPFHVVTRHGWRPIGVPMLVTRTEGTEIVEIGGRPAAEAYEEQLGMKSGELSRERFWQTSRRFPLGLLQNDGSAVLRVALARTARDSLLMASCVAPVGGAVQVMESTDEALLGAAEEAGRAAVEALPDPGVLLAFSCAARALILGDHAGEESRRLQAAVGRVPIFGFCCGGEFARTAGVLATHNATLTAMAL